MLHLPPHPLPLTLLHLLLPPLPLTLLHQPPLLQNPKFLGTKKPPLWVVFFACTTLARGSELRLARLLLQHFEDAGSAVGLVWCSARIPHGHDSAIFHTLHQNLELLWLCLFFAGE